MQTTTVTNLRKELKAYIDKVIDNHEIIVIPRNSDGIVILSLEEYNAMLETQHLLSTEANRAHLRRSINQLRDGEVIKRNLSK